MDYLDKFKKYMDMGYKINSYKKGIMYTFAVYNTKDTSFRATLSDPDIEVAYDYLIKLCERTESNKAVKAAEEEVLNDNR